MLCLLAALILATVPGHAGYLKRVNLGLGVFDFTASYRAPALRAELRPGAGAELEDGDIFPVAGAVVTTRGGLFGYGGVCLEVQLNSLFHLSPSVGVGAYSRGEGKDLGGTFEFWASGSILYVASKTVRTGLTFLHLSNAYYHSINPGSESLFATIELEW